MLSRLPGSLWRLYLHSDVHARGKLVEEPYVGDQCAYFQVELVCDLPDDGAPNASLRRRLGSLNDHALYPKLSLLFVQGDRTYRGCLAFLVRHLVVQDFLSQVHARHMGRSKDIGIAHTRCFKAQFLERSVPVLIG